MARRSVALIRNLHARVGGSVHLNIAEANFAEGCLHLIVGPNASGKTSIIRTMLGFILPEQGSVTWDVGKCRFEVGKGQKSSGRNGLFKFVGYVQQGSDSLWPQFTVYDHVAQALRNRMAGTAPTEHFTLKDLVEQTLESAQVAEGNWRRKPESESNIGQSSALSGGERQRVAYARAIAAKPDVLVFDELEASLDERVRSQFIDFVLRDFLVTSTRHTAFVVTHDPSLWLSGQWERDNRQIWRVAKDQLGQITLTHDTSPVNPRTSLPQDTIAGGTRMVTSVSALSPVHPNDAMAMARMAFQLGCSTDTYLREVLNAPRMIVTVVGGGQTEKGLNISQPVLFVALGPPGYRPDGADSEDLNDFLVEGQFPDFLKRASTKRPLALTKGLVYDLLRLEKDKAYVGSRVCQASLDGNIETEGFLFSPVASSDIPDTGESYLELSKSTKSVYLFRALLDDSGSPNSRLVLGIDLLDDRTIDPYQCYFIMSALGRSLMLLPRDNSRP